MDMWSSIKGGLLTQLVLMDMRSHNTGGSYGHVVS